MSVKSVKRTFARMLYKNTTLSFVDAQRVTTRVYRGLQKQWSNDWEQDVKVFLKVRGYRYLEEWDVWYDEEIYLGFSLDGLDMRLFAYDMKRDLETARKKYCGGSVYNNKKVHVSGRYTI